MQNAQQLEEIEEIEQPQLPVEQEEVTPLSLQLIQKKIPIKYCEFKISNSSTKMIQTDTMSISENGVMFQSPQNFRKGTLMRIWIEMPDYWARKSRHVGYRHTEAPTFFQVLARVVNVEETNKRTNKYQLLCQTVNLDPVDAIVLNDYLGCGVGNP